MKIITQNTHFEDSRLVVLADGSQARVEFKKVPLVARDPLVRVYMTAGSSRVRIASGRLTKDGEITVIGFIASNEIPDVVDVAMLPAGSLSQVNRKIYDMHLGA